MSFETLPILHLDEGSFPEYPHADPERALTNLARRFGRVVLVDVEGVRRNDADLEFIQAVTRKRPVWVDGGSRYSTDAMDLFVAGAERVTLRWNTLAKAEELEEAAAVCEPLTLFLSLEFPGGKFLAHPRDGRSAEDVAKLAAEHSVGLVFVVESEDAELLKSLPASPTPRYLQGPVTPALAEALGFAGVLLAPSRLPEEASA